MKVQPLYVHRSSIECEVHNPESGTKNIRKTCRAATAQRIELTEDEGSGSKTREGFCGISLLVEAGDSTGVVEELVLKGDSWRRGACDVIVEGDLLDFVIAIEAVLEGSDLGEGAASAGEGGSHEAEVVRRSEFRAGTLQESADSTRTVEPF